MALPEIGNLGIIVPLDMLAWTAANGNWVLLPAILKFSGSALRQRVSQGVCARHNLCGVALSLPVMRDSLWSWC